MRLSPREREPVAEEGPVSQLPPQASLFTLAISYLVPRALHVVVQLGIADCLSDEPMDAGALAAATGTGALSDQLNRLLRLLAAHGVFEPSKGGRFAHNTASRLLRRDHPQSMRDFILTVSGDVRWRAAGELRHTVLTGETGMHKVTGMEVFDYNAANPDDGATFDRAMRAKAQNDIAATLAAYDFSKSGLIVDVGGGMGHLLAAILKAGGRGILYELPAVADRLRVTGPHPFDIVGGDFFADPLPAGDTYLLMQVLHDWADEQATAILAAIRRAARPGASLLVIEMLVPVESAPHPALLLDTLMMIMNGGRERSRAEFSDLMAAAGWRLDRVIPMGGPMVILEAVSA
jgi:SAM-dependent methyltransferase